MRLHWRKCVSLAGGHDMIRGAATTDGSVAYVNPDGINRIYSYSSDRGQWSEILPCKYRYFSMAIVQGLLTVIGGEKIITGQPTNKLLSLSHTGRDTKWMKVFPPMPTKRSQTAAISTGKLLIVAGGTHSSDAVYKRSTADNGRLTTVEILDTETLQWSTAASLPIRFAHASATVYNNSLYLLGGLDQNGKTRAVLTTTVEALIQSCQLRSLATRLKRSLSLGEQSTVWERTADVPVTRSTCATLCGWLLAMGGLNSDNKFTTAVHQYNQSTNTWQIISDMPNAFYIPLVAVLPGNKLMAGCQANVYIVAVL